MTTDGIKLESLIMSL